MEKKIFEPARLGNLELKNRLIRSATWRGLADEAGHIPNELCGIYEELARGGVGAIVTGFTSVSDNAQYIDGAVRISNDALIEDHRRLTDICHAHGCPILVQTALGEYNRLKDGRFERNVSIDALTHEDIAAIRKLFVSAAIRAKEAGYDGVQVHAAHGFFLSRFVSPAFNHREDAYGGSTQNRARLVTEIIGEIRRRVPGLHVSMKMNCSDFMPAGQRPDQALAFARLCEQAGVASIEVSGNGTSVAGIRAGVNEAYFGNFALALAEEVAVPVILVGGLRSLACMEEVLNAGEIQFLSLARPLVREPDLPNRWKSGDTRPSKCISCNMCYQTPGHFCAMRLFEGEGR